MRACGADVLRTHSEIKILKKVSGHRNIVRLHDVTTEPNESVQMVFEFLESDLEMIIQVQEHAPCCSRKCRGGGHDPRVTQSRVISHIPEARVKSFFHQLLDGLHFLHLNKAREPASAPAERNRTHAARSLSHLCAAAPATQIIHRDLKVGQRACAPA